MRNLCLFVVITAFSLSTYGQASIFSSARSSPCTVNFDIKRDSLKRTAPKIEDLDKFFKPSPEVIFEFSLYESGTIIQSQSAFIMTYDKNKQWQIRYFNHLDDSGKIIVPLREHQVNAAQANNLWCMLKDLKVLSLPDYNELNDRFNTFTLDTTTLPYGNQKRINMMDGMYYYFNLRSPNAERAYGYGNPNALLKRYSNIQELYNACAIIAVVKKYLKRPAVVY